MADVENDRDRCRGDLTSRDYRVEHSNGGHSRLIETSRSVLTPSANNNEHDVLGSGPEATESERAWSGCAKNPGHKNFIPIRDFRIHHLPTEMQSEDFMEWVKVLSSLTVRLRVTRTSLDRPQDGAYYGVDGHGGLRVGTGSLVFVEPINGPCPCVYCSGQAHQSEKCQKAWKFSVRTAMHVVFNTFEASNTIVDLFFDDDLARTDGRMKSLPGDKMMRTDCSVDYGLFTCICHDHSLATYVEEQLNRLVKLGGILSDQMLSLKSRPVVILSHPHGRPKQVTVGEKIKLGTRLAEYTADTCPGSSGAVVAGWWLTLSHVGCFRLTHCQGGNDGGRNKAYFIY